MSWDENTAYCDGCRNTIVFESGDVSFTMEGDGDWRHYHQRCWQTGWYTGIEPKGEWPIEEGKPPANLPGRNEEPEPAFDHVKGEVRTVSSTGGEKGVKPARFDLLPVGPLTTVAKLYGKGAEKYEDHNWRRGYEWSKSYAAMMRHATQFWNGEDLDDETRLPHLASVVFHAFSLMEFMESQRTFDDRPGGAA